MTETVVTPPDAGQSELDILEPGESTPEVKPEPEVTPPAEEDETPEEPSLEEDEEVEDLPAEEEPSDDELPEGRVNFSQLKKDHPEVLKKYPELRSAYFQAEKYKEVFPTIEDAQAASQKAEILDAFIPPIAQGDLSGVVEEMSRAGNSDGLNNLATNFLPTLLNKDKQLYTKALYPELKKVFDLATAVGSKNGNDNLKNAAAVLSLFIWGEAGAPPAPQAPQQDPEKIKLQQQNQTLFVQQAVKYQDDTYAKGAKHFQKSIEEGLDPEGKLNDFQRRNLVKEIAEQVNNKMLADKVFQNEMKSLWAKAAQSGFPAEYQTRIISRFLGRAKNILPGVKSNLLSEALGEAKPKPKSGKVNVPRSTGIPKGKAQYISPKDAKKQGLSEMDILMRGAS